MDENFDCSHRSQTKLELQRVPMEFAGRHRRHHHQHRRRHCRRQDRPDWGRIYFNMSWLGEMSWGDICFDATILLCLYGQQSFCDPPTNLKYYLPQSVVGGGTYLLLIDFVLEGTFGGN